MVDKLGTKLLFSPACHPEIHEQTKVVNKILGALLELLFIRILSHKLGNKLLFSTTCHLHNNEQTEVVNRTLGALLKAIICKNIKPWDECLPLIVLFLKLLTDLIHLRILICFLTIISN